MKRTDQITRRVWEYCESLGMITRGDRILLGVSGGADSVCLLFLLNEIRQQQELSLRVVHVHHGIRKEAGKDADYVRELCRILGISFEQVNVSVPEIAEEEGLSEEEAGRMARYKAFEDIAGEWIAQNGGTVKIALAHHAGDRAETLLFHLFRGSGLRGLSSIPPMRETKVAGAFVIRPLLCLEREEIEEYLANKGISYRQDATNLEDAYCRNRIRHHILPYAEKEICHGAVRHVSQAAQTLSEVEDYLAQQTRTAMEACVTARGASVTEGTLPVSAGDVLDYVVDVKAFLGTAPLLQKRILMELLRDLSPQHKDLGLPHVEAALDVFLGESGRSVDLPFGIRVIREYEQVSLRRKADGKNRDQEEETLDLGTLGDAPVTVGFCGKLFEFRKFLYKKAMLIPEKNYTKWFDYDKIKNTLSIRTRRTGDYFMIRGSEGTPVRKVLKDYFITEKIPRGERDSLPLLAEGSKVLWIFGRRISECYKVDDNTTTILQIRVIPGNAERDRSDSQDHEA